VLLALLLFLLDGGGKGYLFVEALVFLWFRLGGLEWLWSFLHVF